MKVSAHIQWDRAFRDTNDVLQMTRFQVFFLFTLIDSGLVRFRRRDIKFIEQANAKSFLKKIVSKGYIERDGIFYVVSRKGFDVKRHFDLYLKNMVESNRVWR